MSPLALPPAGPTPLAVSLERLETLLSPYTGIVRELHPLLAAPDEPFATVVGVRAEEAEPAGESSSGGYSTDAARARAAALGEAAERYAGAHVPDAQLMLATADELGAAAVDPARFALFAPEQHARPDFPFEPFDRATRVRWARGFALADGAEAFLPAQLVYLPWGRLADGESAIGHATSSGLACGATLEEAVLAGLLELVERDAFMLAWLNRLSLPLLDWSDDPELVAFAERVLGATGAACTVVDLSVFVEVPVAAAVVHGDGSLEPAVSVGAGAASRIGDSVQKAVAEAFAVRAWGRDLLRAGHARMPLPAAAVTTFRDHIAYYALAERATAARFLTASPERRPSSTVAPLDGATPRASIRAVVERLAAQNVGAYAVDVTTGDVRDAGLHVAKVLAPELCALDVRHGARFLGGRRVYEHPYRLGLRTAPLRWDEVNPDPHPFP